MNNAKQIILTLLPIVVIVLFPHAGINPFPFAYCIPIIIVVWTALKYENESFASVGFNVNKFGLKPAVIGSIAGALLFAFLQWVFFPLLNKMVVLQAANLEDFNSIRGNTGNYIFILTMAWIVGGFYEELVFHGFIFTRLEKIIHPRYATAISFLFTNILFALYHFQLGTSGIINAFVAGIAYHGLMLYFKRNLWFSFFAHAVFDTIALTYIYAGYL
jgi:uncharacterized protein